MAMVKALITSLLVQGLSATTANIGQWEPDQVSTSICQWRETRAAILRDFIYIDGGDLVLSAAKAGGTTDIEQSGGLNPDGAVLAYDLSTPFNKTTNVTDILIRNAILKSSSQDASDLSFTAPYESGGMLANDGEFILYGGAVTVVDGVYNAPSITTGVRYSKFKYGDSVGAFRSGFGTAKLNNNVTRLVRNGAAASAPSENKAWYFSGLKTPNDDAFTATASGNANSTANITSPYLIEVDMKAQYGEQWSKSDLPTATKGRSEAALVWVPVGEQGILVVLGGAVDPEWANPEGSGNATNSRLVSPDFMKNIDVYDVAGGTWHQQKTVNGPTGTRARGCAVVAPAADASSFNIFYYGGYDAINSTNPFYDDTWVLSLPTFTWTQVSPGSPDHGRAGHQCFMPYPDQMMVIGGYTANSDNHGRSSPCLKDGPVVMYNLSSGMWMDGYDPAKYAPYKVHASIRANIGGNLDGSGGSKETKPPKGWDDSSLGDIFSKPYNMKKMKQYWPYHAATNGTANNPVDTGSGGLPSWVAPVVGVIAGLVVITLAAVAWYLWRRRAVLKGRSETTSASIPTETGVRVMSWIRAQPNAEPTAQKQFETTESSVCDPTPDMSSVPEMTMTGSPDRHMSASTVSSSNFHEMPDTQVVELGDTSTPVELHDTGMAPLESYHRRAARNAALRSSFQSAPSFKSDSIRRQDSQHSTGGETHISEATSKTDSPNLASASLAGPSNPFTNARHIAYQQHPDAPAPPDAILTSDGEPVDSPTLPAVLPVSPIQPVSPPSANETAGEDYMTAGVRRKAVPKRDTEDKE